MRWLLLGHLSLKYFIYKLAFILDLFLDLPRAIETGHADMHTLVAAGVTHTHFSRRESFMPLLRSTGSMLLGASIRCFDASRMGAASASNIIHSTDEINGFALAATLRVTSRAASKHRDRMAAAELSPRTSRTPPAASVEHLQVAAHRPIERRSRLSQPMPTPPITASFSHAVRDVSPLL